MSKMGNAHEEFDDGGIRTKDGCYTMIIVVNTNEGKKSIRIQSTSRLVVDKKTNQQSNDNVDQLQLENKLLSGSFETAKINVVLWVPHVH